MHPPGAETVLGRYGEVGLKSDSVRSRMEERLQENVRALLDDRDLDGAVDCAENRLFVETPAVERVTAAVTDAFGVVSASPALRVEPTMEAICDALARTANAAFEDGTFAVRARRAGPRDAHPFSSTDLEREGGAAVFEAAEAAGHEPVVDLDDPDQCFSVECREDDAYVFLDRREGPGGLPLGTQEPLVALVSGGIDSPVAAWRAMKRGSPVYPLYVDLGAYGGVDHRMRAVATVERLRAYAPGYDCRLRVAPGGPGIERIAAETAQYRMVVLRRFMLRVAEAVADELNAVGIVTGESLGQKSSQTARNLQVTSAAVDLPVHRPLLTLDKSAISQQARAIGTYEDATIDTGCNTLAPATPATRPERERVERAEPETVESLAAEAAAEVTVIDAEGDG